MKPDRGPRREPQLQLRARVAKNDSVDCTEGNVGPASTTRLRTRGEVTRAEVARDAPRDPPTIASDRVASMYLRWACEVELATADPAASVTQPRLGSAPGGSEQALEIGAAGAGNARIQGGRR